MAIRKVVLEGDEIIKKAMQRSFGSYGPHQDDHGGYAGDDEKSVRRRHCSAAGRIMRRMFVAEPEPGQECII